MQVFVPKLTKRVTGLAVCALMVGSLGACATSGGSQSAYNGAPITYKYGAQPTQYASLGTPSLQHMAPHSVTAPQYTAPRYSEPRNSAPQAPRYAAPQPAPVPVPVIADSFDAASVDPGLYSHQTVGKAYRYKGKTYTPKHEPGYDVVGAASSYGDKFHGKPTASREIFDKNAMTAAHKTLPLNSMVHVTNLETGNAVLVRINDRGPFVAERIIDLSEAAAVRLGTHGNGMAMVRVRYAGPAEISSPRPAPQAEALSAEAPRYMPPQPNFRAPAPSYSAPQSQAEVSGKTDYVPLRERAENRLDQGDGVAPYIPPVLETAPAMPEEAELTLEAERNYSEGTRGEYNYENEANNDPIYLSPDPQVNPFTPPADDAAITLTIKGPIHMATTPREAAQPENKPRVIPAHSVTQYRRQP